VVRLENGSGAAVLTQSEKAVRGVRVQKVRCDEVELFGRSLDGGAVDDAEPGGPGGEGWRDRGGD